MFDKSRRVRYHGGVDDNINDARAVKRHDLREAIDEVLKGKPVSMPTTPPVGCNVKWWGKNAHWMPE